MPTRTRACSPDWYIFAPKTLPADGAVGVPRNAPIHLIYPAVNIGYFDPALSEDDFSEIVVRPVGGAPIIGHTQVLSSRATVGASMFPTSELAPDTVYEVLDRVREGSGHDASIGELGVRFTFTTGATSTEPNGPTPSPGPLVASYECCQDLCCEGTVFTLEWRDLPDTVYQVRRHGERQAWTYRSSARGVIGPGTSYAAPDFFGDGTYELMAFSLAGFGSNPETVLIKDPCNAPNGDGTAEPVPTPDSVEPTPDAAEPAPEAAVDPTSDGCRSANVGFLGAVMGGLLLAMARGAARHQRPVRTARSAH